MKHWTIFLLVLVLAGLLMGCGGDSEAEVAATVAAALAATQAAMPTATPIPPTDTPEPTATMTPLPTDTPTSIPTAVPTSTATPTEAPTAAPAMIQTELETGAMLYELPAIGFAMTLPADWQVVDLEKFDMAEIFGSVAERNEQLESLFSSDSMKNLVAAGIRFYAINVSSESLSSSPPATINLALEELTFALDAGQYATVAMAQIEKFFDLTSDIEQDVVALGDGEATRVRYTMNLVDALGQSIEVLNTQYIVIDGMTVYIVTLSMPVGLVDDFWQPYAAAVESFRVGE